MGTLTPGLKANLNFSFDRFNAFSAHLQNEYAVYQLSYDENEIASVSRHGQDVRKDDLFVGNVSYNRRDGGYGSLDYNRIFDGDHLVKATALAYTDVYDPGGGANQPYKNLHFGLRGNYSFKNKYFAELTGTFAFSGKLLTSNNPNAFSPGIGFGWVISEESFLDDNQVIDFLKIRANWANISSDRGADYYQDANWFRTQGGYDYGGGSYSGSARRILLGNPDLGWGKFTNTNIGFESILLDYKVGLDVTYFYIKSYDLITQMQNSLPAFYTGNPYQNFESHEVQGIETNLSYDFNLGDLMMKIGGNLTYAIPKALVVDEINYAEDEEYLRLTGKESDAIFGWVAQGFFSDQNEIDNHAIQTFGTVKPGDIKYADLNEDGRIDNLDRRVIGNSSPRLDYGLNFTVSYENLGLFALASGQAGGNNIYNNSYYWVDGNNKYSEIVLDRWTPTTQETATYPRLTTSSATNNFRNSSFWIENNNWLKLHTVQLNYHLPKINFAGIKEVGFYLRGNDLLHISKIKEKRELNIGSAPQTRAFSLGLTVNF
jgi:hypothetical protein